MSSVFKGNINTFFTDNINSFFEEASNEGCLPENCEQVWAKLRCFGENIGHKSTDTLSPHEVLLKVYCSNPWPYWDCWTTSSLGQLPEKTYPINKFMDTLVELINTIEEEERKKTSILFYVNTLCNEVFIYFKKYMYFIVLLCAIIGYNLA